MLLSQLLGRHSTAWSRYGGLSVEEPCWSWEDILVSYRFCDFLTSCPSYLNGDNSIEITFCVTLHHSNVGELGVIRSHQGLPPALFETLLNKKGWYAYWSNAQCSVLKSKSASISAHLVAQLSITMITVVRIKPMTNYGLSHACMNQTFLVIVGRYESK